MSGAGRRRRSAAARLRVCPAVGELRAGTGSVELALDTQTGSRGLSFLLPQQAASWGGGRPMRPNRPPNWWTIAPERREAGHQADLIELHVFLERF
jgi:hypothetical protein